MEDTLLEEVKSYINFTWEDEAKENRIKGYIKSSKAYLQEVAGTELVFTSTETEEADELARDLLFNRVLYMDSQALDDFAKNYNGFLDELKIKYAVLNDADQNSRQSV